MLPGAVPAQTKEWECVKNASADAGWDVVLAFNLFGDGLRDALDPRAAK